MSINIDLGLDLTGATKELDKLAKEYKKFASKSGPLLANAAIKGLDKSSKAYVQLFNKQAKAIKDLDSYESKLRFARSQGDIKEIKRLEGVKLKSISKVNSFQDKIVKSEDKINKLIDQRNKARKEYVKYMEDAESKADKVSKLLVDSSKGISESVGGLVGALRSGNFGDLASSLSGRAGKAGSVISGRSKKEGDMLSKVGGSLGKMAKALGAVAGVAAGVGMIVKLLIDAEAKTKGLNKTLLEGLGTTTLMGSGFRGMTKSVGVITEEAADLFRFMEMGLNAEEFAAATIALDQAGVSVRTLTNDFKSADGLTEALKGSQVVATTFGINTTEAIQNIGETVENLNMGYGETVDRLTMISRLAKESGFNTKRFYSTVLSATTGMTMYNIRLEEAGTRLIQLTKAVGKQQAIQMLPGMTGGFKDEGMQERIKRLMITGGAGKRILKAEAGVLESRANKQLEKTGETLESIAKMDRKTQTKFLSNLEYQKKGGVELANLIKNALEARGGAKGGLGAQAQAMDQLSIGGKLAFQQAQLSKFVKGGFKNLDKAGAIQLMAAEQLTGMSMSEMKANARYFKSMEGVYNILKDSDITDSDAQEALADKFGVSLKENGELVSKNGEKLGFNINNMKTGFDEFLMASGNQAKIDGEVQKDQRQLMEEQVSLTQTLGDKIDQGVTYFLEMIWRNTNDLLDFLPDSEGAVQRKFSEERLEEIKLLKKLVEGREERLEEIKNEGGPEKEAIELKSQNKRDLKVLNSLYSGGKPFGSFHARDPLDDSNRIMTKEEREAIGYLAPTTPAEMGKTPRASNGGLPMARDFVYADGKLTRIDSKDQFIGGKVGGGAISALIEAQEESKTSITGMLNKQLEADRKYRKRFDENMKREYPEIFAEKYIDALDMKEFENFLDVIGLTDAVPRKAAMRTYERTGRLTAAASAARRGATREEFVITGLDTEGNPIYGPKETNRAMADQFGRFGTTPQLNDYIWRSGASAPISFSPDDTVVAMKDFSNLGGGGGTTINIYGGDERKVFNVVRRAMKQMSRSA